MLEKLLPRDTIVKRVYTEMLDGKTMFGRQIGSYPLLIGIPGFYDLNEFVDVCVVGYGFRSITGIIYTINLNIVSREMLEVVPGVGKKRAIRILANRPFKNKSEFINCFDDKEVAKEIIKYFTIK
jgi:radical SAM superfamily enzyme with C-terminal helix-hairpin-helix motif